MLLSAFYQNPSLNQTTIKQLARQTGLIKTRIISWFKRKRKEIREGMKTGTISSSEGTETDRFTRCITDVYNVLDALQIDL